MRSKGPVECPGFEPRAEGDRRSAPASRTRCAAAPALQENCTSGPAEARTRNLPRARGALCPIEPPSPAWKAGASTTRPLEQTSALSGGADSNHLLGSHNPALCRLSYAPEYLHTAGGTRTPTSRSPRRSERRASAVPPRRRVRVLPTEPTGLEPALPRWTVGCAPIALRLQRQPRRKQPALARRTNDAPTRESRSRVRTPPAHRPAASACVLLHTHPSVVKEHRAPETPIAPPGVCAGGAMVAPHGVGPDRCLRSRGCPSRLRTLVLSVPHDPTLSGESTRPPEYAAITGAARGFRGQRICNRHPARPRPYGRAHPVPGGRGRDRMDDQQVVPATSWV